MTILPMGPEHIPALADLEKTCFSQPWSESALTEELQNPAARFTVAVIDGETAGYLGFHHVLDEGSVADLAVFPAHRRKGVARALLADLIGWAAQQGIRRIFLEVRVSNLPAVALYEETGFLRAGIRPGFYADPAEDAALYILNVEVLRNERTGI